MVEQSAARTQQCEQLLGVGRQHRLTHVLRHADACNRVEGPVVDVAIVLDTDLYAIADALSIRSAPGIVGLLARESDANRLNSVVASSIADKGSPTASDVQDPHARLETELVGDEVTLGLLCVLQPERGAGLLLVVSTRVRHRRAEDQLVEVVPDVIVVSDGLCVPAPRVAQPAQLRLLRRWSWWRTRDPQTQRRLDQGPAGGGVDDHPWAELGVGDLLHRRQTRHDVPFDQHVAGDVGAGEPELIGSPQHAAQGAGGGERQLYGRGRRPDLATVPTPQAHRQIPTQTRSDQWIYDISHAHEGLLVDTTTEITTSTL